MKRLKGLYAAIAIAGLCVGASVDANADLTLTTSGTDIDDSLPSPDYYNFHSLTVIPPSQAATDVAVLAAMGLPSDSVVWNLWKLDLPSTLSGQLAGSYTFGQTTDGGTIWWTISYTENMPYVDTSHPSYVLLKDGQKRPIFLWDLEGIWNGTDAIRINATDLFNNTVWDEVANLSHLEIGGVTRPGDTPPVVPEPATLMAGALLLLPFGASAVRILRRKSA